MTVSTKCWSTLKPIGKTPSSRRSDGGAWLPRLFGWEAELPADILEDGALQEVIGGSPHQADSDDLSEKRRRPEQTRQRRLNARLEVGLDHEGNERPGPVTSDDEHRPKRKSPAELLGVECLLSSRLYGDLLTVVGRGHRHELGRGFGFPGGKLGVPCPNTALPNGSLG